MLPELNKKRSQNAPADARNSQSRFPIESDPKDTRSNIRSVSSKKVRTGGGFMKTNPFQQLQQKINPNQMLLHQQTYQNYQKYVKPKDLSAEIKLIEKKIKACQKKIEEDKKRQKQLAQEATRDQEKPQYSFDKVVQRELQMQGYESLENNQNFDYLTNPRLKPGEEQEPEPQPIIEEKPLIKEQKPYNIQAGVEKLEKFYENSLKKKFERREMFPHQACRRKTPKLYITHKTNSLNKYGKAQSNAEHLFRVLTKQTTPQQIYPTIPNFAVVKDNLSKNIVAYLGDYKPFLQKAKQNPKDNESNKKDDKKSEKTRNSKQLKAVKDEINEQDIRIVDSVRRSDNLIPDGKNKNKNQKAESAHA